ncbi:MAG: hypothetical protein ACREYF_22775 [Gammaproteobacteria bacterium]
MITEALQQLAGIFSRRFFFNALLPTFIFVTAATSTIVASSWSIEATFSLWERLGLLTRLLILLAYFALVYFLSAAVQSQWRNIVRLFEGYPLRTLQSRFPCTALVGENWHEKRMKDLQGDDEEKVDMDKAYSWYPLGAHEDPVKALPTRLGNILLAGEHYSYRHYGIDTIIFWPRLYPLLPESFQREYGKFVIQHQFPLVVAFEASITTAICAITLLVTHASAIIFVTVLLSGTVVAYGAYILSLESATELAEQQRAAFDLFRDRLLIAWPAARDVRDEKLAFKSIHKFVKYGDPADWERPRDAYVNRRKPSQGAP